MRLLTSIVIFFSSVPVIANDNTGDLWWAYLAEYKSGAGSTLLNLTINSRAPIKKYQYLLKVGVEFKGRSANPFPTKKEFKLLYKISDHRLGFISKRLKTIKVGTFTYKGVRSDYYYVQKKGGITKALAKFYKRNYPGIKYHTSIKSDPQWIEYRQFLFPNKATVKHYKNSLIKIGYLKPDGAVVDDQIKQFWAWFSASKSKLHQFMLNKKQKKLSALVSSELRKINKKITFEIGGKKDFTISANGDRKYFTLVQRIVIAAPKIKGWTITAFRQRLKEVGGLIVNFSDVNLSASNIWFKVFSKNNAIRLTLCIKGYKQQAGTAYKSLTTSSKRYIKAAYILLDATLGEYDATVNVSGIDFCPLPAKPKKLGFRILARLPFHFDRLQKKIKRASK